MRSTMHKSSINTLVHALKKIIRRSSAFYSKKLDRNNGNRKGSILSLHLHVFLHVRCTFCDTRRIRRWDTGTSAPTHNKGLTQLFAPLHGCRQVIFRTN